MVTGVKGRWRDDDGANAVEFALILPVFVVLIFGGIWSAIALNHDLALSSAAREGARYAATLSPTSFVGTPPAPDTAWFTSVLDRTEGETTGSLGVGVDGARICVAFIDESGNVTAWERTWPGGDATSSVCYADGLASQARVQVTTERRSDIQAVMLSVPVTVHTEAVARYEREVG